MTSTNAKTAGTRKSIRRKPGCIENQVEDDASKEEKETQTSKTILQLAHQELERRARSPEQKDDGSDLHFERLSDIYNSSIDMPTFEQEAKKKGLSLTRLFLSKHSQDQDENHPSYTNFQVASTVDQKELANSPGEKTVQEVFTVPQWSRFHIREIRVKSIDAANNLLIQDYKKSNSTGSVPDSINLEEDPVESVRSRMSSARRGRSLSPPISLAIEDQSQIPTDTASLITPESIKARDYFHLLTNQVKSKDWNVSLKAMVEIADLSKSFDQHQLCSHTTDINQRLIEFLRSPRSQVCRAACQIAGKLFESIKDTRRPEFDDIVELLLMKTADSNKFIRKDANVALDCMIMNISHFHTIRAIGQKGPMHKNDLIRISSARLFVCIVGIAGVNAIMSHHGNDSTRQRIFRNMIIFIKDKNFKTREYGIRLYKLLREHPNFDCYLKKLVDKNNLSEIKKIMKKL